MFACKSKMRGGHGLLFESICNLRVVSILSTANATHLAFPMSQKKFGWCSSVFQDPELGQMICESILPLVVGKE
ncbi:hypothetical protein L1987_01370 [Smallanthus sonchifolius]|uniref:Uncharacterized protein n=1 Tax=Smallanthus sonchifolius TaxID=185202 RepID=A0ACB9K4W5_9ASTR|nr:hypothetical protein L1987_01370 [Smallanthus sonchifolius]